MQIIAVVIIIIDTTNFQKISTVYNIGYRIYIYIYIKVKLS